jgi:transcriptional regulator with XRE-family HTH domain
MRYRFGAGFSEAVQIRGLTAQKLAQLAQVSPATASAALRGRDVQMASALRIARAVTQAPVVPELEQWGSALADD